MNSTVERSPEKTSLSQAVQPLKGLKVVEFTHMVMGPTRGMVLADLGAALARQLCADADVVAANFKPGTMHKVGLDYTSLAVPNTRLTYVSHRGFLPALTTSARGACSVRSASWRPSVNAALPVRAWRCNRPFSKIMSFWSDST